MEKIRSSPLSFLFPWLSPLVIKFAIVNGGIDVQLYRSNRLLKNWHDSKLRHVLPEPLTKWIDDYRISMGPQPYPLIKQLWQYLTPLASKKLIIDSSVLAELEDVSQPQDFALVWVLNRSLECIEGRYEGADRYLGMGWFQKGTKIWSLNNPPSNATGTTPLTGERAQATLRGRPPGRLGLCGSGKGCVRGRPRGRFGSIGSETAALPRRRTRLGATQGVGATFY